MPSPLDLHFADCQPPCSPPTQTIATPAAPIPTYSQQLNALDLATGLPEIQPDGVPVATPSGQVPPFYPTLENQRPALLLNNGTIYIAFGSYGGQGDYHAWLFGYDSTSLQ
jgi:hypothetical protein